MATTKKNVYIEAELAFAEEQLASWRAYIENNPVDTLVDRVQMKTTKAGGVMPMVVASIESQGKFIQDTLSKYLQLLEVIAKLRAGEEAKKELKGRGDKEVPGRFKERPEDTE